MKVRMTFELSDPAREYIVQMVEGCAKTTGGLASREACIAFLKYLIDGIHNDQVAFIKRLNAARAEVHFGPLTDSDIGDANKAVEYLRAQGKSDGGIRQWLLNQRALAAINYEKNSLGLRP